MQTIIKEQNKNLLLDTEKNKLTLLDGRYYYDSETQTFVPSVTTILSAYPKNAAFYEWLKKHGEQSDEIRDEAGRKGSIVHDLTERFDNGEVISLFNELQDYRMKISDWAFFERYVEFRSRFPFTIELNEQNFVSSKIGYGGTIDRVIIMDGLRYLIDIKTSNYLGDEFWLQIAAYKKMYEKMTGNKVDRVGVLWLNSKTKTQGKAGDKQGAGYQLIEKEDTSKDYDLFLSTKSLWENLNKNAKPKNITYSLTHKL